MRVTECIQETASGGWGDFITNESQQNSTKTKEKKMGKVPETTGEKSRMTMQTGMEYNGNQQK